MLQPILEAIGTIIGSLIIYLITLLIKKINNDKLQRQLYEALEIGVSATQEAFVTWAKRSAADGKLTKEERQAAVLQAWTIAKELTKNSKINSTLQSLTFYEIDNIIKNILAYRKRK